MKPFLLICLVFFQQYLVEVTASRKAVFASIFHGYSSALRPIIIDHTQTTVFIQMQIMSLLEVNEQQEYIKASITIKMWWTDQFLTWDPSNFNGTDRIKVPASNVWQPDMLVTTTSLQPEFFMASDTRIATIYANGTMLIQDYPFDEQECIIKITSWAYPKEDINFVHWSDPDLSMPVNPNTVWDIFPYVNDTFEMPDGLGNTLKEIHYKQKIKRKSTYYVWVLIAPTFIITALSLAGLYSPFSSTGEREEKVTLGLTTLLTLAIILTMVTGDMPRGSNLPVLGRFVLIEIVLIVVSMAIAVMTMFFHERATTRRWQVPTWLGWLTTKKSSPTEIHPISHGEIESVIFKKPRSTNSSLSVPFDLNTESSSNAIVSLLQKSLKQLNETHIIVCKSLNKKEKKGRQLFQWLLVVDRLDLCLFISFQLIHVIAFILVFYQYYGKID